MTTPPPPQQQPGQPPPPPPQDGLADPALAVAVAAILAGTLGPGITVAAAVEGLKARFILTVAALSALDAVLSMVMEHPPPLTGVIGPASEQTSRVNTARRAQYVLAAAKRVIGAARQARAKGEPVRAAVRAQLAAERRYYEQHQAAMWQRATAAGRIDMEAAVHGPLLGWYTTRTKTTTPECLAADKHNFYVSPPPRIGLPGIGPHAGCRCRPGPPWPGGKLLAGSGPKYRRAA